MRHSTHLYLNARGTAIALFIQHGVYQMKTPMLILIVSVALFNSRALADDQFSNEPNENFGTAEENVFNGANSYESVTSTDLSKDIKSETARAPEKTSPKSINSRVDNAKSRLDRTDQALAGASSRLNAEKSATGQKTRELDKLQKKLKRREAKLKKVERSTASQQDENRKLNRKIATIKKRLEEQNTRDLRLTHR